MAPRTKVKAIVQAEPITEPVNTDILDDDSSPEFTDLMTFLEELGDSQTATVSVYRDVKGRATGSYLFKCTPSEFAVTDVLDKLRDEYGGGTFRIVIYASGQRLKNQVVQVEAPIKSSLDFLQKNQQQQPAQQNELASALLQIQDSMRQQSDAMRDLMLAQQQENTRMLLDVLKSSKENAPQQTSLSEMVQLLGITQTLAGSGKNNTSATDMMEMFFKGMELGGERAGGGDESVLQTAIRAFAPALSDIGKLVNQTQQNNQQSSPQILRHMRDPQLPQAQGQSQISQPQNIQRSAVVDQPGIQQQSQTDSAAELLPYLQMLLNAANRGADQETYANLLCDQVPEPLLHEYLDSDVNYGILLGYFPVEAAPLHPWFDSLRELVLEFLAMSDDSGASNAGQYDENVSRGTGSQLSAVGDTAV